MLIYKTVCNREYFYEIIRFKSYYFHKQLLFKAYDRASYFIALINVIVIL